MERTTFRRNLKKGAAADGMTLARIRRSIAKYLEERGVGDFCKVWVNAQEDGYEIAGTVDSQWTRAVVFLLMRPLSEKSRIIDLLEILDAPFQVDLVVRDVING